MRAIKIMEKQSKFDECFNKRSKSLEDGFVPSYTNGWEDCKSVVLEILFKSLKNLDLSEDFCEQRYIEEIKKL